MKNLVLLPLAALTFLLMGAGAKAQESSELNLFRDPPITFDEPAQGASSGAPLPPPPAEATVPPPSDHPASSDGVITLTPDEISQLLAANSDDQEALRQLMDRMAIPRKSVVFVTRTGAVVCPVDSSEFRVNLLFINFGSSHIDSEPSEQCQDWIRALREDATLDQIATYLDLLGRTDRDRILYAMIEFLAARDFGITPAHLQVLLLDLRPDSDLSPDERSQRQEARRLRMQELLRLRNSQTEQTN